MMTLDELVSIVITHIGDLRRCRVEYMKTAVELAKAEWNLKVAQAQAEARAIQAVGGDEKALGTNAEARQRALTLAVAQDEEYRQAWEAWRLAMVGERLAAASVESAKEYVRLLGIVLQNCPEMAAEVPYEAD